MTKKKQKGKRSNENLKEIGAYFGIDEYGVSQSIRCVSLKINTDKKLRKQIMQIEDRLKLSRA